MDVNHFSVSLCLVSCTEKILAGLVFKKSMPVISCCGPFRASKNEGFCSLVMIDGLCFVSIGNIVVR